VNIKKSEEEEDPLSVLGYGIVAYVDILYSFACLFVFFSIILIPTIMAFNRIDGNKTRDYKAWEMYMVNNLGYSSVECEFIPVSVGRITMQCPYGSVGRIYDYGINVPETGSPINACLNNNLIDACKPDSPTIKRKLEQSIGAEFQTINLSLSDMYNWPEQKQKMCRDNTNYFFVQYTCE